MALAPYVLKGATRRALGFFNSLIVSANTAISASATQTLAGATVLTASINVIGTVAASGNAVRLPALAVGQSVEIYNTGANPASIFPPDANTKIDGGGNGASVTLTNALRAKYTCVSAGRILSAQLGAVSA